jgi:hypothetical protein
MCLDKEKLVKNKKPISSIGYCAQILINKNYIAGLYYGIDYRLDIQKKIECDGIGFHGFSDKKAAVELAEYQSTHHKTIVLECLFEHLIAKGELMSDKAFRSKYRTILKPISVYYKGKLSPIKKELSKRVLHESKRRLHVDKKSGKV